MRALIVVILLAAASLVVLWQFNFIGSPFGSASSRQSERVSRDLFAVAKSGGLEQVRASLSAGGNVAAVDAYGQTPLMYAASGNRDPQVLATLLQAGADINAQTGAGWTALMYAARDNSNPEVVLLLLNAGASPSLRDAEGKTAFNHATGNAALQRTRLYRQLESLASRPFDPMWPSGFIAPVEGATFSSRASHLPNSPRNYRNGIHEGFDFYNGVVSVPIIYGTPVIATADGVIVRADHGYVEMTPAEYDEIIADARVRAITPEATLDRLRGRQVVIEHIGGHRSRYAHLTSIPDSIQVGTRVRQGTAVGLSGNSGTIEGVQNTQDDPHPHYELWNGNTFMGQDLAPRQIYELVAQVFGPQSLPPFTE